jgi:hypothetical protein
VRHLLDEHRVIAWDMDGTLIEGPNSAFFREYIATRRDKEHHVVTFRTPQRWVDEVYDELAGFGIRRDWLAGVHGVPVDLYHAYAQQHSFHQPDKVNAFVRWKGLKAKEIGATVLIDDMHDLVVHGCNDHGVCFLHAHAEGFLVRDTSEPLMDDFETVGGQRKKMGP